MNLRSLAGRFVASMVAGALILTIVAAALSYRFAQERTQAEVRATLDGVMTAIEKTVATGAYADDRVLLGELVDGMIRHPQIDFAQVTAIDGEVLATATDSGASALAVASATQPQGLQASHSLASPFDDNDAIGTLVLHADADYLRDAVRRQAAMLAVMLVGLIAILALLLNTLTLRLVVQPMSLLARQLSAMEPGSAHRLTVADTHANDEIGTMVQAANRLLDDNQAALSRERAMREEVAAMEARYRQIFDHTSAGIFLLSPQLHLINSNRQISQIFGASEADLNSLRARDFFQTLFVDPASARELATNAAVSGQTASADLEIRTLDNQRRWVHCLISIQSAGDDQSGHLVEGVIYDVTQRRLVESEFAYMVEHDSLTGLKSRTFFHNVLRRYVERARPMHASVTVVFVDLDQFKLVNDTHGHEAGDRVLVECAHRLQRMLLRSSDLAARLGGDEFTIILDGVGAEEPTAQDLARRIVRAMLEPIEVAPGVRVRVGASVGLASFPMNAADSDELVRAADRAMYEVKRLGKNSWRMAGSTTALAG